METPQNLEDTVEAEDTAEAYVPFLRPLEDNEVDDVEKLISLDRQTSRMNTIAWGAVGAFVVGSAIMGVYYYYETNKAPRYMASQPHVIKRPSIAAPPSKSPSPSPTPSPSLTPAPASHSATPELKIQKAPPTSPSHIPTSLSASPTLAPTSPAASPTPEVTETQPAQSCIKNENVPGEIICETPVWAYTTPDGTEQAFQVLGGAAIDCSQITAGRVPVSNSNASGWGSVEELGNPC